MQSSGVCPITTPVAAFAAPARTCRAVSSPIVGGPGTDLPEGEVVELAPLDEVLATVPCAVDVGDASSRRPPPSPSPPNRSWANARGESVFDRENRENKYWPACSDHLAAPTTVGRLPCPRGLEPPPSTLPP